MHEARANGLRSSYRIQVYLESFFSAMDTITQTCAILCTPACCGRITAKVGRKEGGEDAGFGLWGSVGIGSAFWDPGILPGKRLQQLLKQCRCSNQAINACIKQGNRQASINGIIFHN